MLSRLRKWKKSITNRFTRSNSTEPQSTPYIGHSPLPEPSFENLSALEALPHELLFPILEFAPDVVLKLRLSSRMLKFRVEAFATQTKTIPLAYRVEFSPVSIQITIPDGPSNLFEIRLKARLTLPDLRKMRRDYYFHCGRKMTVFDLNHNANWNLLDTVKDSLGKAVDMIDITDNASAFGETNFDNFSKMLEGFQLRQLKLSLEEFSTEYSKFLLDVIDLYHVEKLTLSVYRVTISEPVNYLLKLSMLLRALCVIQHYPEGLTANNFLFGVRNADWAPIFIDMLSTSKMLDKICIYNKTFPAYLNMEAADLLKERLPYLGKRVWLSASCECFLERIEYMENDYVIKADGIDVYNRTLRIKHWARKDEEF